MDEYYDDFDDSIGDISNNNKEETKQQGLFNLTDDIGLPFNLPNRRRGQQQPLNKTQTFAKQPEQFSNNNNNNTEDIPDFLKESKKPSTTSNFYHNRRDNSHNTNEKDIFSTFNIGNRRNKNRSPSPKPSPSPSPSPTNLSPKASPPSSPQPPQSLPVQAASPILVKHAPQQQPL